MGVQLVKVPLDWHHPVDETGEFVAGAHHELLYHLGDRSCTAFQLYENVSEGSPISPIFEKTDALGKWMTRNGWPDEAVEYLLSNGYAPSLVLHHS